MSQSNSQDPSSPTQLHLRSDLAMFTGVLLVVLAGVIALYVYDQRTGVVTEFSSQLFHWLID